MPAAPAAKLAKGATLAADELVLDLEDAVVPAVKDEARAAVADALARRVGGGVGRRARQRDRHAVVPPRPRRARGGAGRDALRPCCRRSSTPDDLAFADRLLDGAEAAAGRATPLRLQALIETAAGLAAAAEIARASERLDGLILGYADLAASLGRTAAAQDWRYAQETRARRGARAAGLQAIDGPHLGIRDDDAFRAGVAHARDARLRRQVGDPPRAARRAAARRSRPTDDEVADAREVLAALDARRGRRAPGAVALGGQMLDEALALSARRVLARAGRA